MTNEDVLAEFESVDALLKGHFILSSGRHSPVFLQKALVFSHPEVSARLCAALAKRVREELGDISVVAGPAVGGIVPGYEMARQLGARAVFAERKDGQLVFRRGFEFRSDDRILLMEDIVTTGKSFLETVDVLNELPGTLLGGGCIIDRSGGKADVGTKLISLASIEFPDYAPEDIPPELAAIPTTDPGSRRLS